MTTLAIELKECKVSKILIVDDDPDIQEACKLVLEKEGFQVKCASNRVEGLQQVADVKPDLLILDVMMEEPDDGLIMAHELRRQGFAQPIIMLTSVNAAMGLTIDRDDEIVPVEKFQSKPVEPADAGRPGQRAYWASRGRAMLTITDSPARDEIVAIVERHGGERTSLIPILLDVKTAQHHITDDAMQIVADLLGVHPVEVYSVATFYAFLGDAPEGRFVVRLCGTLSCDLPGKTGRPEALRVERSASTSAPPPTTASSPWSGRTASACATRARPCS